MITTARPEHSARINEYINDAINLIQIISNSVADQFATASENTNSIRRKCKSKNFKIEFFTAQILIGNFKPTNCSFSMMEMKLSQLVVFLALIAIGHAHVASVPITLNSLAPVAVVSSASLIDNTQANEFNEWAEYKVKSL